MRTRVHTYVKFKIKSSVYKHFSEVIVVIIVKNTIRYLHDWFIVITHPNSDCQRADFKVMSQQTAQLYNIPQMRNLKKLRLDNQPTTRHHKQ